MNDLEKDAPCGASEEAFDAAASRAPNAASPESGDDVRDAENEALLSEAAFFAARYGISPRLFDYYSKTAAASPNSACS